VIHVLGDEEGEEEEVGGEPERQTAPEGVVLRDGGRDQDALEHHGPHEVEEHLVVEQPQARVELQPGVEVHQERADPATGRRGWCLGAARLLCSFVFFFSLLVLDLVYGDGPTPHVSLVGRQTLP
jgi:hypothetical protein